MGSEEFYREEFYRITSNEGKEINVEYKKNVYELKCARDGVETPKKLIEESVEVSDKKHIYFQTTKTDGKVNKKQRSIKKIKNLDKRLLEEFKSLPEHIRKVIGI